MKIPNSLFYGLLAIALVPALAQQPASQIGKIHGRVINFTGDPQPAGLICLSTDGGVTLAYTFPVDSKGNYSGEAPAGTYTLVYRMPDTPPTLWIDALNNITLTPGKDLEQNDDMSREQFIAELPDEQKKQLEELKKHKASAQNQDQVFAAINSDLNSANQDLKLAETARAAAQRELKTADPSEIDAKAAEIRNAKCAHAESLMLKDFEALKNAGIVADETSLWEVLGRAQIGLNKFDEAEKAFKRVLEIQSASGSPKTAVQAMANAALGEIYARTSKPAEAAKAYDLAVQLDAAHAGAFFRNQAVAFQQAGNADAQIAAAEKAIKADPKDPLPYYIKANGLFKQSGIDPASKHYDLPAGCAEAYEKYLKLAPAGPYASEAQSVLRRAAKTASAAK